MNIDQILQLKQQAWPGHVITDPAEDALRWNAVGLLASEFMKHQFGVLNPLEWKDSGDCLRSASEFTHYVVEHGTASNGKEWFTARCIGVFFQYGKSIEHSKKICQSHYEAAVASLFTRIGGGT